MILTHSLALMLIAWQVQSTKLRFESSLMKSKTISIGARKPVKYPKTWRSSLKACSCFVKLCCLSLWKKRPRRQARTQAYRPHRLNLMKLQMTLTKAVVPLKDERTRKGLSAISRREQRSEPSRSARAIPVERISLTRNQRPLSGVR